MDATASSATTLLDTRMSASLYWGTNATQGAKTDMSNDPQPISSLFGHVDVTAEPAMSPPNDSGSQGGEMVGLLKMLLQGQAKQNELLAELVQQTTAVQRQRATELGQWKKANPYLATRCREAAESLSEVQTRFLADLTEEIQDNSEHMLDGDFMLNEFVDRFGPRLAHLNGVLQVLSQLSSPPSPPGHPR